MASSPHFIFSWPVLLLYYVSSHFPVIFRLCLFSFLSLLRFFSFPCSLWFLKFSSDALADSLPQLFSYCFQIFFCERSTETGCGRLQLSFCLYCSYETLGKAVYFLDSSLVDGRCGLHSFLGLLRHQMPCGILTRGRMSRLGEETRILWWCWCWYVLPSSVSVPNKQFELGLFSPYSERLIFLKKITIPWHSLIQLFSTMDSHYNHVRSLWKKIVTFLAHLMGMIYFISIFLNLPKWFQSAAWVENYRIWSVKAVWSGAPEHNIVLSQTLASFLTSFESWGYYLTS